MARRFLLCLPIWLALLLASVPSAAQDRAALEREFRDWLERSIWPEAESRGVQRTTFERAFDGIRLNWSLPDLVPPGSEVRGPQRQSQAEFGAPKRYFSRGALEGATAVGRRMADRHEGLLERLEAETGVPGRITLAIWGRESGYGQADIPHKAFEVLGTKGFMSTRAPYFTDELIAALEIAESGNAPSGTMRSSWAGALGQPQFMPSNYLQHAADGDGDGHADIWQSEADTLASIANYLKRHGWVSGRDWGFEVTVPQEVSCALEGPDQGRSITDWADLGIERVSGRPFPDHERDAIGYLLMPAGRLGPAFIVTPNFYALKEYNFSDLYALFVGHVGDRIQYSVGDFRGAWVQIDSLYRSDVAVMQQGLEALGHDVGGADGLAGFRTRRSIGRWQEATGSGATCFPNAEIVRALRQ